MKRRASKKRLRNEEKNILAILRGKIESPTFEADGDRDFLNSLSSGVINLLIAQLRMNSVWPHRVRWLDDIEWSYLKVNSEARIEGAGTLWWGDKRNFKDALTSERLVAYFGLRKWGQHIRLSYSIEFGTGSGSYRFQAERIFAARGSPPGSG